MHEREPAAVGAEGGRRVVDELVGQRIERESGNGGALVGLAIGGFTDPAPVLEEQAEARFRTGAVDVQGVHVAPIGGLDQDADLLVGFAGCSIEDGVAGVELAGRTERRSAVTDTPDLTGSSRSGRGATYSVADRRGGRLQVGRPSGDHGRGFRRYPAEPVVLRFARGQAAHRYFAVQLGLTF